MSTIIRDPRLQAADPVSRRRIANAFSTKRDDTLKIARHLLACLIRLSHTPAYAEVGKLLPSCQTVLDELSGLNPTNPMAKHQLAKIALLLTEISRSGTVCTERQHQMDSRETPRRHCTALPT